MNELEGELDLVNIQDEEERERRWKRKCEKGGEHHQQGTPARVR